MQNTYATQVQTGTSVYGSDGEKIGDVAGVADDYFVIEKGFIFTTDLFVPFSAIAGTDDDGVRLSVTKDQVENEDWSAAPTAGAHMSGGTTYTDSDIDDAAYETTSGYDRDGSTGDRDVIERREERLTVDKETEKAGELHVGKTAVTDSERVEETVRREEFDIDETGTTRQNR